MAGGPGDKNTPIRFSRYRPRELAVDLTSGRGSDKRESASASLDNRRQSPVILKNRRRRSPVAEVFLDGKAKHQSRWKKAAL